MSTTLSKSIHEGVRHAWVLFLAIITVLAFTTSVHADSPDEKRAQIDATAAEAMTALTESNEGAAAVKENSVAYAVFRNLKVAFGISGGGGSGVAVSTKGERVYMKMGTGGIGLGIGAQKYTIIFFFQTDEAFRSFVDKGWQADAAAQAAAGEDGANAAATFKNGVAFYQMTEEGLIASADISGTKYWKNDDLNETPEANEAEN